MVTPWQVVRRFLITGLAWSALAAGAAAVGTRLGPLYAYAAWIGVAAVLCAGGALLIRSQPLGTPTVRGMLGYQVVHFGFRAGQGRLPYAAIISWLVWAVVGAAVIWTVQGDRSLLRTAMAATWLLNTLAIFYVSGIALRNRPKGDPGARWLPPSLAKGVALLAAVTVASTGLWFGLPTPGGRLAALVIAATPAVVIGGAFGVLMLVFATMGRKVRWN